MAMNVSQFVSSDNFNMAEFNDMISQINSGVNSEVTALTTLINSGAKIQTGSYVGTGTYGESNPCSLTFDTPPKLVWLTSYISSGTRKLFDTWDGRRTPFMDSAILTTSYLQPLGFGLRQPQLPYGKKSNDGKTIYWYNAEGVLYQYNETGDIYNYIAFF